MGALQAFDFEEQAVRVVLRDGESWFVAADVCRALDLKNSRDAIEPLDEDEKDGVVLTDTIGRQQKISIISEGGLYTLVLRCRDAVKAGTVPYRFRRWVTHEVLPAIRKSGSYDTSQQDAEDLGPLQSIAAKARLVEIAERISGKNSARMAVPNGDLIHQSRKCITAVIRSSRAGGLAGGIMKPPCL
jgi:prophage antirepressor-like protein